jgi:hypothetical protein
MDVNWSCRDLCEFIWFTLTYMPFSMSIWISHVYMRSLCPASMLQHWFPRENDFPGCLTMSIQKIRQNVRISVCMALGTCRKRRATVCNLTSRPHCDWPHFWNSVGLYILLCKWIYVSRAFHVTVWFYMSFGNFLWFSMYYFVQRGILLPPRPTQWVGLRPTEAWTD